MLKNFLTYALRTAAVCVVMIASFILASGIANPDAAAQAANQSPEEAAQAGMALLLAGIANALLLAYPIIRSRWYGFKLTAVIAILFFMVQTFMSQIEVVIFGSAFPIPEAEFRSFFVRGSLNAVLFAPLAVLIMGRMRKPGSGGTKTISSKPEQPGWFKQIAFLPLVYIVLYFLFGYYIAWQSPDVRVLYSGSTHILPFFEHMKTQVLAAPELVLFQYLRGLVWIVLGLPVLRMLKGKTWEKSILVGLLFGLLLTTQLLFPNPYMPAPVRMAHFIETSTSTFIYGWLIGQIFDQQAAAKAREFTASRTALSA